MAASSKSNQPDDRSVYLALRHVFSGSEASIRNSKAVKERISKHVKQPEIRALLLQHNLETISAAAKTLLKDQIFASSINAKLRFPELFDVSPAQSAERALSLEEATRYEDDAVRSVAAKDDAHDVIAGVKKGKTPALQTAHGEAAKPRIPSLYPIYLDFPCQLRLLRELQTTLEQSLYAYARDNAPDLLQEQGWHCAEAGELNIWMGLLKTRPEFFASAGQSHAVDSLQRIFASLIKLRHTAVHRLPVTAQTVSDFLSDAEAMLTLLGDEVCQSRAAHLRRTTTRVVDDLKRNKDLLETKMARKVTELDQQRAEIDRLEKEAVQSMVQEDREYQCLASQSIFDVSQEDAGSADVETSKDADTDDLAVSDDDIEVD